MDTFGSHPRVKTHGRCGLDGSIVVDFLETCLSHGMGKEAELEDLIEKVRAAFG